MLCGREQVCYIDELLVGDLLLPLDIFPFLASSAVEALFFDLRFGY